MTLNLRRIGDTTIMQASGTPTELADFIELAKLIEVPIVVDLSEDVLAEMEVAVVGGVQ